MAAGHLTETNSSNSSSSSSSKASSPKLTIAFIGAKSVGKTSIIRQFISNQFGEHGATLQPRRYQSSLVSNNRIIDIDVSDFPAIDKFPEDSLAEWNLQSSGRCYCRLRQASAFVLVFDASRPSLTFQYIRHIRDQMLSYGSDMYKKPIVVAANKQDLRPRLHAPSALTRPSRTGKSNPNGSSPNEWSCLVRKQWRCTYVECSAKFNWQVVHLFQEVLSAMERCSTESSSGGAGESRNYLGHSNNGHHQHLLHLPHLAQLAQLGHLAHLGHLNMHHMTPSPPEKKSSTTHAPPRSRLRSVQCPVC